MDPSVPVVAAAAPPPAAPVLTSPTDILRSMSAADRSTYERTGEMPDAAKPVFSDDPPASSAAPPVEPAASTDATPPAASEPAKGKGAEARKLELQAEIDGLLKTRATLRAETAPRPPATLAAPPPAVVDLGPKPDSTDYTTYPLGTSDPQYVEDLAGWKAQSLMAADRTATAKRESDARVQSENQRMATEWQRKVEAVTADHPDAQEKFTQPIAIPAGSGADVWILESEMGPKTLYHLYDHPEEVARITALPPVQQIEAMVMLGLSLKDAAPAVKTKTDAPAPVPTLDTRASGGANDADAALARGDVATYMRLQNEADLAKSGIRGRK